MVSSLWGVGEMEFSDWYFPGKIDLVRIERLSKNKIRELMEEKGLAGLLQQT